MPDMLVLIQDVHIFHRYEIDETLLLETFRHILLPGREQTQRIPRRSIIHILPVRPRMGRVTLSFPYHTIRLCWIHSHYFYVQK